MNGSVYGKVALLFSVAAFVYVIVKTGDLSIGNNSAIVEILALLTTILIGFQILNYLTFECRMEKIAHDVSDYQSKKTYLNVIKDVYETMSAESLRLIAGNIYYCEWYKSVVMHRQLLHIARVLGDEENYKQQFQRAKSLSDCADKFDDITMNEFKEYILELRSLSATTDLGTDICLELEKKYL